MMTNGQPPERPDAPIGLWIATTRSGWNPCRARNVAMYVLTISSCPGTNWCIPAATLNERVRTSRPQRTSLGTSEEITANPDQVDPDNRHEGEKARDTCPDRAVNELEVLGVKTHERNARDVDRDHRGACRETPPDILRGQPAREGLGKKGPPQHRERDIRQRRTGRFDQEIA